MDAARAAMVTAAATVGLPPDAALVVIVLAAVVVIIAGGRGRLYGGYPVRPRPAPDERETVARAARLVHQLVVAPEAHHDAYDREAFGNGWVSQDGCSTRDLVLRHESLVPPTVSGCSVVAGEWHSWYDGRTVTDPGGIDIDHLVPLAEAWSSGAHAWTDEQRRAFANDLDRPDALVAVTAAVNREKGDLDPNDWRPHHPDAHCRYAAAWVIQKHTWGLTADAAEYRVLVDILTICSTVDAAVQPARIAAPGRAVRRVRPRVR